MIYAITDIHGRLDLLEQAINYIRSVDTTPRIIGLGDYIDRGPRSRDVIEYLMNSDIECLTGNHEDMFRAAVYDGLDPESGSYKFWATNGGSACEMSYAGDKGLMRKHADWMATLPTKIETPMNIFVHAGLNPDKSVGGQSREDMIWIRQKFLFSHHDFGKHVVHGHTPKHQVELYRTRTNLDIGAPTTHRMAIGVFDPDVWGPLAIIVVARLADGTFDISSKVRSSNGVWS